MTMSVRSPCAQLRSATGVRSVAVPRLPLRNTIRVHGAERDDVIEQGKRTTGELLQQGTLPSPTLERLGQPTQEVPQERVPSIPVNDALGTSGTPISEYTIFNPTTELINGRAAMLGFTAAIISEATSHQAVWSQMAGRFNGLQLVERPSGQGLFLFAVVVALTTLSTLIPKFKTGEPPENRAFFPFTATAELWNGRAAQIGFLSLILVEAIKGNALFS